MGLIKQKAYRCSTYLNGSAFFRHSRIYATHVDASNLYSLDDYMGYYRRFSSGTQEMSDNSVYRGYPFRVRAYENVSHTSNYSGIVRSMYVPELSTTKAMSNGYKSFGRFEVKTPNHDSEYFYDSNNQGSSEGKVILSETDSGWNIDKNSGLYEYGMKVKISTGGDETSASYSIMKSHHNDGMHLRMFQMRFNTGGDVTDRIQVILNNKHKIEVHTNLNVNNSNFRLNFVTMPYLTHIIDYDITELGSPTGIFVDAYEMGDYYILFFTGSIVKIDKNTLEPIIRVDYPATYTVKTNSTGDVGYKGICEEKDGNAYFSLIISPSDSQYIFKFDSSTNIITQISGDSCLPHGHQLVDYDDTYSDNTTRTQNAARKAHFIGDKLVVKETGIFSYYDTSIPSVSKVTLTNSGISGYVFQNTYRNGVNWIGNECFCTGYNGHTYMDVYRITIDVTSNTATQLNNYHVPIKWSTGSNIGHLFNVSGGLMLIIKSSEYNTNTFVKLNGSSNELITYFYNSATNVFVPWRADDNSSNNLAINRINYAFGSSHTRYVDNVGVPLALKRESGNSNDSRNRDYAIIVSPVYYGWDNDNKRWQPWLWNGSAGNDYTCIGRIMGKQEGSVEITGYDTNTDYEINIWGVNYTSGTTHNNISDVIQLLMEDIHTGIRSGVISDRLIATENSSSIILTAIEGGIDYYVSGSHDILTSVVGGSGTIGSFVLSASRVAGGKHSIIINETSGVHDDGLMLEFENNGVGTQFVANESIGAVLAYEAMVVDNSQSWRINNYWYTKGARYFYNFYTTPYFGVDRSVGTDLESIGGFREVLSDDWSNISELYRNREIPLLYTYIGDYPLGNYDEDSHGIAPSYSPAPGSDLKKWAVGYKSMDIEMLFMNPSYNVVLPFVPVTTNMVGIHYVFGGDEYSEIDDGVGGFNNVNGHIDSSSIDYTTGIISVTFNISLNELPNINYFPVARKSPKENGLYSSITRNLFSIGWYLNDYIGTMDSGSIVDDRSPFSPHIFVPDFYATHFKGAISFNRVEDLEGRFDSKDGSEITARARLSSSPYPYGQTRGFYNGCKIRIVDALHDKHSSIKINQIPYRNEILSQLSSVVPNGYMEYRVFSGSSSFSSVDSGDLLRAISLPIQKDIWDFQPVNNTGGTNSYYTAGLSKIFHTELNTIRAYPGHLHWETYYNENGGAISQYTSDYPNMVIYDKDSTNELIQYAGEELLVKDYYCDNRILRLDPNTDNWDFTGNNAQKVKNSRRDNYEKGNILERKLECSNVTGSFVVGEDVTGVPSGAVGTILSVDSDNIVITLVSGVFTTSDVISATSLTSAEIDNIYQDPIEMDGIDIWRSSDLKGIVFTLEQKDGNDGRPDVPESITNNYEWRYNDLLMIMDDTSTFSVGDSITGDTSSDTGIVSRIVNSTNMYIKDFSGNFESGGESINTSQANMISRHTSGAIVGHFTSFESNVSSRGSGFRGTGIWGSRSVNRYAGKLLVVTSGVAKGQCYMLQNTTDNYIRVRPDFGAIGTGPEVDDGYRIIDAMPVIFRIDDIGKTQILEYTMNQTVDSSIENTTTGYLVDINLSKNVFNNIIGCSTANWVVDSLIDCYVVITDGVKKGEAQKIISNTTNTITIENVWNTSLSNSNYFKILDSDTTIISINRQTNFF